MAKRMAAFGGLALVVREEKGLDQFYEGYPDKAVIDSHFDHLKETEDAFFSADSWKDVPAKTVTVKRGELNTPDIAKLLERLKPDYVAVFGPGIIKPPLFETLPEGRTFNLHQGLSPYYRGSGTNFWPFVEGKLGYIGVTLHFLDKGIDTGGILAHDRPDIEAGDTLHRIGCKTVVKSADALIKAIKLSEAGAALTPIPQTEKGKLYKRADMNGEAVRKARRLEAEGLVEDYVRAKAKGEAPVVRLIKMEY
jgi:phosphoribosylglycinamide formyltransferase 1